jgi:BlaI family transcriptional regulator, penicillinase repressor
VSPVPSSSTNPDDAPVALSDLQMDVMRALWRDGERSVGEVTQALHGRRGLAHTTVSTLLTRLQKRGLVSSRRDGRQLMYRAEVDERQVRRSMVSGLLGTLFGGDAQALVAHLVREDEISAEDLVGVRRLLDRKEASDV